MTDDNKIKIANVGGIEAIVEAMKNHIDAEAIQNNCCEALDNLSENDDNEEKIANVLSSPTPSFPSSSSRSLASSSMRRGSLHLHCSPQQWAWPHPPPPSPAHPPAHPPTHLPRDARSATSKRWRGTRAAARARGADGRPKRGGARGADRPAAAQ